VNSSKMNYLVAGSVVGGAVGFLFLTDPGRKVRRSIREFDPNIIPEKLDDLRDVVERAGREISGRVEAVRHRLQDSVDTGRHAYSSADTELATQLHRLEAVNNEVSANLHRAIDELNKTVYTIEKSILGPAFEVRSLIRAVKHGLQALKAGPKPLAEAPRVTGLG
jgi:gas vesicle protein